MIKIYGASDDLIEVEGDISEEFNPGDDDASILALSDGTVLRVRYDGDGCWRVERMVTGSAAYTHESAEGPDTDRYSDVATLEGDIRWCVRGDKMVRANGGR